MKQLTGKVVSPGVALAPACIHTDSVDHSIWIEGQSRTFSSEQERVESERQRFALACAKVEAEIESSSQKVSSQLSEEAAEIFEAHLLFLQDEELLALFDEELQQSGSLAEDALMRSLERCKQSFLMMEDDYLRQRVIDLQDVWFQVIAALRGHAGDAIHRERGDFILVAKELYPSTLAKMPFEQLKGIVTEEGGELSHIAVMAHSLGVPYLIDVDRLCAHVEPGQMLALDGEKGLLYVEPDFAFEAKYQAKQALWQQSKDVELETAMLPGRTRCGEAISLRANVNFLHSVEHVALVGGEGIGLFRTEFLFMGREMLPAEDEQYALYREVAEKMAPAPVTFRILDIGGDKQLSYFPLPEEENPQLGWRGIRVSLAHDELLLPQLCALWRASAHGNVRVMVPVLSTYEEVEAFLRIVEEARRSVLRRGLPVGTLPLGLMVETPSAALMLDFLADAVDFFSVGTNDLLQLLMGADRNNRQVGHLVNPLQPALLRLLGQLCEVATRCQKPISVCGEMASDPLFLPLLIGLGFRELSVASRFLPVIRQRLHLFTLEESVVLAEQIAKTPSHMKIFQAVRAFEERILKRVE